MVSGYFVPVQEVTDDHWFRSAPESAGFPGYGNAHIRIAGIIITTEVEGFAIQIKMPTGILPSVLLTGGTQVDRFTPEIIILQVGNPDIRGSSSPHVLRVVIPRKIERFSVGAD